MLAQLTVMRLKHRLESAHVVHSDAGIAAGSNKAMCSREKREIGDVVHMRLDFSHLSAAPRVPDLSIRASTSSSVPKGPIHPSHF